MTIFETIQNVRQSLRTSNPELYVSLTTLYSECQMKGKNAGNRLPTDEECVAIIKKFIEGQLTILTHNPSNEKAKVEVEAYKDFLPKQFTKDELRAIIEASGMTSMKDVMAYLKSNYAGQYDGKVASIICKEIF